MLLSYLHESFFLLIFLFFTIVLEANDDVAWYRVIRVGFNNMYVCFSELCLLGMRLLCRAEFIPSFDVDHFDEWTEVLDARSLLELNVLYVLKRREDPLLGENLVEVEYVSDLTRLVDAESFLEKPVCDNQPTLSANSQATSVPVIYWNNITFSSRSTAMLPTESRIVQCTSCSSRLLFPFDPSLQGNAWLQHSPSSL